jgi:hypothetical protein
MFTVAGVCSFCTIFQNEKKNENTVMNILKRSNHMDNADIILLLLGLGISLNSCTGYKIFFSATSLVFH